MPLKLWPSKRPPAPPDGVLPVTPPSTLLARHDAELAQIRQLAGVPAAHWEAFYLGMLRAFADFVQELPASETHHHAGPGGLLAHGLEVTREALKLRRGHMLPAGEAVGTVAGEQDLWTYAVAAAALLHDLGKRYTKQPKERRINALRRCTFFVPMPEARGDRRLAVHGAGRGQAGLERRRAPSRRGAGDEPGAQPDGGGRSSWAGTTRHGGLMCSRESRGWQPRLLSVLRNNAAPSDFPMAPISERTHPNLCYALWAHFYPGNG